ncbi:helix-turn-helix domain-containing protein [Nocardia sp. NPDC057227]|uniref:helix-turn-helix domain-containing protein n=1 Tax=Nocardia sp. NPDC057227 TaxID=3346056 RepID=UPI00363A9B07
MRPGRCSGSAPTSSPTGPSRSPSCPARWRRSPRNWTERQLRTLFAAGIGLSPKHYARIARLRLVLAHAGKAPWAHLAADTGYYDHSHLTAEFRRLMGVSPSAFARGALPAATGCTPLGGR